MIHVTFIWDICFFGIYLTHIFYVNPLIVKEATLKTGDIFMETWNSYESLRILKHKLWHVTCRKKYLRFCNISTSKIQCKQICDIDVNSFLQKVRPRIYPFHWGTCGDNSYIWSTQRLVSCYKYGLNYIPHCISNLEQVEDLLAKVQLKVCVVGSCHVIDEHQAIPLGLKAVGKKNRDVQGSYIFFFKHNRWTAFCKNFKYSIQ